MAQKFFELEVSGLKKTTPDSTVISFHMKEEWKDTFAFKHGQHLTLRLFAEGREIRRSYSLCSSPFDGEWKVAVKKVKDGIFSTYVNEKLKIGDVLEVMPPKGSFHTPIAREKKKNYLAFAAGSGITPVISIIKTHLIAEPECQFTLFYSNRSSGSIMLKEELEALKNRFIDRLELFYILTREERDIPLLNGRITAGKLDLIFSKILDKELVDEYFLCGPEKLIFLIRDYLLNHNTDRKNIHFELFQTSGGKEKTKTVAEVAARNGKSCEAVIIEGGKRFKLTLRRGVDKLLDEALKQSADLPYACKGGMCCTCKARLLEGQVEMEVCYGLEPEEVEEGYILTCQSIPVSERIVVDYDI